MVGSASRLSLNDTNMWTSKYGIQDPDQDRDRDLRRHENTIDSKLLFLIKFCVRHFYNPKTAWLKKNVFDRLFFQKPLGCKKTSWSDPAVKTSEFIGRTLKNFVLCLEVGLIFLIQIFVSRSLVKIIHTNNQHIYRQCRRWEMLKLMRLPSIME